MRVATSCLAFILSAGFATAQTPVGLIPEELAPGVWFVEMPTEPEFIGSNIGIVELSDGLLVIDAGFPIAARLVQDAVKILSKKPIKYVIDTHFHPDHSFGNAVFADAGAIVIASAACIEEGKTSNPIAFAEYAASERGAHMFKDSRWQSAVVGFDEKLVLDAPGRGVEVIAVGQAHTKGDAVVWLPHEKILFTGDACVNGPHNFMGNGDSAHWITVLDRLAEFDAAVIAPGHGTLGDAATLRSQRRWFADLREHVAKGLAQDQDLATITQTLDLPWYREWAGVDARSRTDNVARVFDELTGRVPPRELAALELEEGSSPSKADPGYVAPKKIVLVGGSRDLAPALKYVAAGVELVVPASDDDAAKALADADAVIGTISPKLLEAAPKLRWAQVTSAGVERFVGIEGLAQRRIVLTNAQRLYGPQIAEHVIGMMLALVRGLDDAARLTREGRWDRDAIGATVGMSSLRDKTVLVAGIGGIGLEVARRAKALGMTVVATKTTKDRDYDCVDHIGKPAELNDLAARSDFVVNCLPLTRATTHLFDAAFFDAAKKGLIFVNIGRGKSVDTDALVAALKDGRVRAAALDVADPEPLPPGHALWSLKNVLITPHVSAQGPEQEELLRLLVRENVRRFVAGERLLNVVDVARGY